ncbi:MAG: GGDEF domain-containing protein [Aquificaceae bacterium]|nr:GGDEF domain-containing protein [Aquificaceae bacterium]
MVSFILLYAISSRLIESRVTETYELVYKNYKEILNREEKNLRLISEDVPLKEGYQKRKLSKAECKEKPHYRVLATGPHYGINRIYSDGCYFVGTSLEEILRLISGLMDLEWVIYYERRYLNDILETSIDEFIKGKIVIENRVIDRFSSEKVLNVPAHVTGYALYGSMLEKALLMEIALIDHKGFPFGKILLVKDISVIYREAYVVFVALALYSIVMVSFLSLVLLKIVSALADRIIFLKDVTASIEKKDFSVVKLLENSHSRWKDEVYELKHSIQNMAVSLKTAFEELEKKQKELEQLAYYDPLTGLPNRRFFFDHANLILESSKRYGTPLSLLVMDIDHFKRINDTYGHEAGDIMLKSFAEILRKSIRQSDMPARFGGEEFVLLMPNTNLQQGKVVAERIRVSFQNNFIIYDGNEINTTLSGGLVSFSPNVESIDELIKMADEALYKAKESGRNRIEIYEVKK